MTDYQRTLANAVASALSGPTRLGNIKQYGRLIRIHGMSNLDALWVAAGLGDRAPIASALNYNGITARDHHAIASQIRGVVGIQLPPRCDGCDGRGVERDGDVWGSCTVCGGTGCAPVNNLMEGRA